MQESERARGAWAGADPVLTLLMSITDPPPSPELPPSSETDSSPHSPNGPSPLPPDPDESAPLVTSFRRGHPVLAWIVIAGCVLAVFAYQYERGKGPEHEAAPQQALGGMRTQGRYLLGSSEMVKQQGQDPAKQAAALDTGGFDQRLRYVILIGELSGPERAREQLRKLDEWVGRQKVELSPTQKQLRTVVGQLYRDYADREWAAPSLTADDRALLRRHLDWFGELALAPADGPDKAARDALLQQARMTTYSMMGGFLVFLTLGLAGGAGLLFLLVSFQRGRLSPVFQTGSPAGGIYAETFAVWMLLFVALQAAARFVVEAFPSSFNLSVAGAAMLLSLGALAWARLRGLPWSQVRREVGLNLGTQPKLEPAFGVATYAMALPLLLVGVSLTLFLMRLKFGGDAAQRLSSGEGPSHPIVEALFRAGWWGRVQIFLMASVVAPLVEETMFRGVLYRHLREASAGMRAGVSAVLSATVVSFVFAIVHPQGLLGVPALMALAYAFALAREWRGTLLPAMIAHGLNNGIVFTATLWLAS